MSTDHAIAKAATLREIADIVEFYCVPGAYENREDAAAQSAINGLAYFLRHRAAQIMDEETEGG